MGRLVKRHTDSHPAMAEVVNRAAKSCGLDRLVKKTGSGAGLEKARRLRCVACAWHATQQQATHDGLQRARRPATRAMPMSSADRRPQVDVCRIITCGQAFRLPATLASRLNVCARHWPASAHPPCAWPCELVMGCCRRFARRFKRASQERTHRSSRVALSSAVACMSFHSGTVPALVPCVNVGKRVIRCLVTRAVSRRRSAKCEGAGLAVAPRPAQ
jgi:hypothetical protein